MRLLPVLVMVAAGFFISIQGPVNARLRASVDSPVLSAAISFLSGEQVRIPAWADDLGLGWLWRSLSSPSKYGARYWDARRLVPLLIRYKDKLPNRAG